MGPLVVNGEAWRVVRVSPDSPSLVDRTGARCLATTDPWGRVVYISKDLTPPLLDKVLLHEVAHAITMSYGLLDGLHAFLPEYLWVPMEEWAAQLVENHAIEASVLASEVLGRPICVRHTCIGYNGP